MMDREIAFRAGDEKKRLTTGSTNIELGAFVAAARRTCLPDNNLVECWQRRRQFSPDPYREVLAGRVFKPLDVIEVVVIEASVKWCKRSRQVCKIVYPPGDGVDIPAHVDFDLERMAVQAGALVVSRNIGQAMGGLDLKNLEDFHASAVLQLNKKALARRAFLNLAPRPGLEPGTN